MLKNSGTRGVKSALTWKLAPGQSQAIPKAHTACWLPISAPFSLPAYSICPAPGGTQAPFPSSTQKSAHI